MPRPPSSCSKITLASSRWSCSACGRRVRVVRGARVEERLVERAVALLRPVLRGEQRRAEPLRAIPRRPDQRHEPRRLRRVVEREVEVRVRAHRLAHVAGARRRVEARRAGRARPSAVRVREPLGGPPHGERLEREPHLEEVAQLVDVEVEDARALVRARASRARAPPAAAPPRGSARCDMPSDRASSSSRSGVPAGQLAQDDRLAQLLEGVLGHRPVPHRPLGCRRLVPSETDRPITLDQMSNVMRGSWAWSRASRSRRSRRSGRASPTTSASTPRRASTGSASGS